MEVNKLPPEVVALTSNSSITICISNAILLPTPTQHIHIHKINHQPGYRYHGHWTEEKRRVKFIYDIHWFSIFWSSVSNVILVLWLWCMWSKVYFHTCHLLCCTFWTLLDRTCRTRRDASIVFVINNAEWCHVTWAVHICTLTQWL